MRDIAALPIDKRFDFLEKLAGSDQFLKKKTLANEIPFYICPYDPAEEELFYRKLKQLMRKLDTTGIKILEVNLYDLAVEILQERGIWEKILAVEQTLEKGELMEMLQGVLDSEAHLVPAIKQKMDGIEFSILFITGVGAVYPYIRSHNVLNNLQSVAKDKPTVLFFPGEFTHSLEKGASLNLFGRLHDDKYYRAFNIYHCEF